jgi:hypothetical protein
VFSALVGEVVWDVLLEHPVIEKIISTVRIIARYFFI